MCGTTAWVTLNTPADVGIQHVAQLRLVEHAEQIVAHDAAVVDQHVDAAARARRGAPRPRRTAARSRTSTCSAVTRSPRWRAAGDHGLRRVRAGAIEERHVRSLGGERLDDGAADAAAAAGDEHDLTGEPGVVKTRLIASGQTEPEFRVQKQGAVGF